MEKRNLLGKEISLLGFGLMRLPKRADPNAAPGDNDAAARLMNHALEVDYDVATELIDHAMANGINYYDTAYTYGGSEAFAGYALSRHPRESYYLATKCPPWKLKTADDFERIFEEQLKQCKTDYFDFYLVHNFAEETKRSAGNEEHFEHFEKIKMYEILQRKKAEGLVRHVGFSFHGTPSLLQKITDMYKWDFAQIQVNYIDWAATDAKAQYEILAQHNLPVSIMEPLRGGALANLNEEAAGMLKQARPDSSVASWGLRYAASLPNVMTVLSGMNAMEQLTDNLATMESFEAVSETEKELLYKAASIFNRSGAIPCTACSYCMPCPKGVNIPRVFSIYNHARLLKRWAQFDNGYSSLNQTEKASNCVQCGQCVKKCPQHLAIPDYLNEVDEYSKAPV